MGQRISIPEKDWENVYFPIDTRLQTLFLRESCISYNLFPEN